MWHENLRQEIEDMFEILPVPVLHEDADTHLRICRPDGMGIKTRRLGRDEDAKRDYDLQYSREYRQRPEYLERNRNYRHEYWQRAEVKERRQFLRNKARAA